MLSVPFPKPHPHPLPRTKPFRLRRKRNVTIAIHLSGGGSLLTATDSQETYTSGEKIDSGKTISAGRSNPLGTINIAGAGDSEYIKAVSQEFRRKFQSFTGSIEQLEEQFRETAHAFYSRHVLPFVGGFEDEHVPDYSLLIAAYHEGHEKLWNIEKTMLTDDSLFATIGAGKPAADAFLNRLYPRYPTLDSLAILAAYVIYQVKNTVEGCGLKTEIRFLLPDRWIPTPVSFELIEKWESLFRRYDRLGRDMFFQAMNFPVRPPEPPPSVRESMQKQGILYDHEQAFPAQMKPLGEIVKDIEEIRAEFAKLPSIDPRNMR